MSDATSTIELVESKRVLVQLHGDLSDSAVRELATRLLPILQKIGPNAELIVDLQHMESCTTAARMALTDVQRDIAGLAARTAFVADRPRFRGIGLFVAHTARDSRARSFHTMPQAYVWLRSDRGRIETITAYLGRNRKGAARRARARARMRRSSEELRLRLNKSQESDDGERQR